MKKEIWKDIPNYESIYMASSFWRIKSLKFWTEKILKMLMSTSGYHQVCLCNWKSKRIFVHRIIAYIFLWLDINDRKTVVCHIDDNKLNNYSDNLFIWTQKDNLHDMINKWRKWRPPTRVVNQYSIEWEFIKEWSSISIAEKNIPRTKWSICWCCKWKRKLAWWFIWKYKN